MPMQLLYLGPARLPAWSGMGIHRRPAAACQPGTLETPLTHNVAPCPAPQPGDSEWRFWRAWSLYNIRDFPPSNIYLQALPSQVRRAAVGAHSARVGSRDAWLAGM